MKEQLSDENIRLLVQYRYQRALEFRIIFTFVDIFKYTS